MAELSWFELFPPRDLSLAQVTALIRTLAGRPRLGVRQLQPLVVFELWLARQSARWLMGCDAALSRHLPNELTAQVAGLVIARLQASPRQVPMTARQLRLSSLAYPLRQDTASNVAAGLLAVRHRLGRQEAAVVQWLVGPSQRYSSRPAQFTPLEQLGLVAPVRPDATERSAWRDKTAEALFAVRGRVGAVAGNPKRAAHLISPLVGALSLTGSRQARLTATPQSAKTAEQLFRVTGRVRSWSSIVNAAELASLLGLPVDGVPVPGGDHRLAPPPAALLTEEPPAGDRVLGASQHPRHRGQVVAMPFPSHAAHSHLVAPSGTGKSSLCAHWTLNEVQNGRSIVVIEPKGDLITDVLSRLSAEQQQRTVVIDPGADGPVVGLNPLAGPRADAERRADSLLHLFRELYGSAIGPRSADTLLHAAIAICRLEDGTLPDLVAFLTNAGYRRRVLAQVSDPLTLAPWAAWFDGISDAERGQVVSPVMNKLRSVVSRPALRRPLSTPRPAFRLDDLFQQSVIVLVNLNAGVIGPEASALLGSLLLNQLWEAIQRQTAKPHHQRREVSVIVDEFGHLVGALDFADVLARSRGARVAWTLSHQDLSQLSPHLRAAVLANCRSRVVLRPAEADASVLARVLGEPVTAEQLLQLPAFHAVARVLVDAAPSTPFEVRTPPLPPPTADPLAVQRASAARYGVDPADLDAAVEQRWQGESHSPDTPIGMKRRNYR